MAMSKANAEGKLVMLVVVEDTCKWCKKLSKTSLVDEKVKGYISKEFIPVLVKRNQASTFPAQYQSPRIPIIHYIDPKGEDVWETVGYRDTKTLFADLKEAKLSYLEDLAEDNEEY